VPEHCVGFPDLHTGERVALAPVIGLMLLIGVLPGLIVNSVNPTVLHLLSQWRF
jgi:NADH-quinone oxidoreductase subunit M